MADPKTTHSGFSVHSKTASTPTQKQHSAASTKLHSFHKPACELQSIDIWCGHAEKPEHEDQAKTTEPGNGANHASGNAQAKTPEGGETHSESQGTKANAKHADAGKVPQLGGAGNRHARIDEEDPKRLLLEICPQIENTKGGAITFSNGGKPDTVMFAAKVNSADKWHPLWTLEGPDLPRPLHSAGMKTPFCHDFVPKSYQPDDFPRLLIALRWLKGQKPQEYLVTCEACKGQKRHALIRVFAPLVSEVEFETKASDSDAKEKHNTSGHPVTGHKARKPRKGKYAFAKQPESELAKTINNARKTVVQFLEKLVQFIPNVKDVEVKILEGSLSLGNKWEEEEDSNLAPWKAEIGVHLVLVDIGFVIAIFNLNFLPKALEDTLEDYAGVKLEAFGGFRIEGSAGLDVDVEATSWKDFETEDKGVGEFAFGVEAKAVGVFHKNELVSLTATGLTSVELEFTPKFSREPQITLERKVVWHPFTVKADAELRLSNKFKPHKAYEHECFEPETFYPPDIHLLPSSG